MDDGLGELPVRELLARLATADPVPGGGSAAAFAGAMAAALLGMVVELTMRSDGADASVADIAVAATTWRSELLNLAELDAIAYQAVVRARRLPRDTDRDRDARDVQIGAAIREATRAPIQTLRAASEVIDLAERLAPLGARRAISDVGVAVALARAAAHGAALNVRINLPYVRDEPLREEAETTLADLLPAVDARATAVAAAVEGRIA